MLRSENPFNRELETSTTFAIIPAKANNFFCGHGLYKQFVAAGGTVTEYGDEFSQLRVNHSHLDGLGTLYFLDRVLKPLSPVSDSSPTAEGSIDSFLFRKTTVSFDESSPIIGQTFTQLFLQRFFRTFSMLQTENIGFVINTVDTKAVFEANIWGNGIAVDVIPGNELLNYATLPKTKWRRLLNIRSQKTLAHLSSGKEKASIDSIVISSIGDLSRLSWAESLNPSNFIISATPTEANLANLTLWSRGGIQSISVCASPDHWIFKRWNEVLKAWNPQL